MHGRVALLIVVTLISCQQQEVPDSVAPSSLRTVPFAEFRAFLRDHAPAGAVDCGLATSSERSVYVCAEEAFRADRPFYCVFSEPVDAATPSLQGMDRHNLASSILARGLFSSGDGVLHSATLNETGNIQSGLMFAKDRSGPALHTGGIVRPPGLVEKEPQASGADMGIDGIVIIQCLISPSGAVDDAKVLKAIAGNATSLAEKLVRSTRFRPGTIFGYALPVYFHVTVRVNGGSLRIVNPRVDPVQDQ